MSEIEFWFDFSSGYAYFAAQTIDAVAARHGRQVLWRPYMLGTAFRVTGARGLSSTPLKKEYAQRDWQRLSRITGAPFSIPANHPIVALPATRAYYWIEENAPEVAHDFARKAFHAYYVDGVDMTDPHNVARVASPLGVDEEALVAGVARPEIKELAKQRSEEAIAKGVFGSPFFLVDGEPFWGWDRIPMLESWLERGRW